MSKPRLLRGYLRIPTLSRLKLIAIVPLFLCMIVFVMLENLLMVAENLWQPCFQLCFPGILLVRILASYSKFSGQAGVFIDW
jgi:hypothetical protein